MDSERECCSSSNESVLESDNDIYTEESDEEGGAVLVPRKTSSRHGGESQNQTDLVLHIIPIPAEVLCDSRGPLTFFIGCVRELRSKPIIQRSPRGQIADKVLQFMEEKRDECSEISVFLLGKVYACLVSGDKYKLPTTRAGYMWNSFHRFRNGQEVKKVWKSFITTIQAPSNESELALQVLLSAIIEKMLSNKASACASSTSTQQPDLTEREKNAVRYMAGYVAVSLLKRYKKPSSNKKLTLKRKLFVTVLQRMSAENQPDVESVEHYSTLWSELIDRGGIFKISDQVFLFMLEVEKVVRGQLNVKKICSHQKSSLADSLTSQIMESEPILSKWEEIADCIPRRFEKYSVELLKSVVHIWSSVRLHAFAKGWTMNFEKRYQKGTRKTLQTVVQSNK